ncbi:MAG: DUF4198 domain-containing protein [Verrucomicrobia bacterium]|nr:DUF4198 domain-containing protein [Verrucomicrobiota bacterium]
MWSLEPFLLVFEANVSLSISMHFSCIQLFRNLACTLIFLSSNLGVVYGHDLFLRPEAYRIDPKDAVKILVFDGTFDESVYPVPRGSVDKLEMSGSHDRITLPIDSWERVRSGSKIWRATQKTAGILGGTNLTHTSSFVVTPSTEGSHTIVLTLYEFRVALSLEDFTGYLRGEAANEMDLSIYGFSNPTESIKERFTKVAKTIVHVGDKLSDDVTKPLGLLVEIVPMSNPGTAKKGDTLEFQILEEGKPLINQSVVVGRKMGFFKDSDSSKIVLHSNDKGIVSLPITHPGVWWLKFILLQPAPEDDAMDFFSRWSSLTFEVN